jgi:uncharacterized RDD family membrane protein YckC
MQIIRVRTTQNVFIDYPVGSVGDRILAYLLDRLILIVYSVAVLAAFTKLEIETSYLWLIFFGFPWLFYSLLFEIFMDGQTPGKKVMKIKVVRLDGTPPTIGDYLLRWIFAFVDIFILSGAVAVVMVAMGGKGQRLGDVVAGTAVVKLLEHEQVASQKVFVEPEEQYTPVFSQVVSLSDRDIELVQRALEANRDQGNMQPVIVVTDKIKSLLKIETDMPPVKFLYTIIKDYQTITAA